MQQRWLRPKSAQNFYKSYFCCTYCIFEQCRPRVNFCFFEQLLSNFRYKKPLFEKLLEAFLETESRATCGKPQRQLCTSSQPVPPFCPFWTSQFLILLGNERNLEEGYVREPSLSFVMTGLLLWKMLQISATILRVIQGCSLVVPLSVGTSSFHVLE